MKLLEITRSDLQLESQFAAIAMSNSTVWWRRDSFRDRQYRESTPKWHVLDSGSLFKRNSLRAVCGYTRVLPPKIRSKDEKVLYSAEDISLPPRSERCTYCETRWQEIREAQKSHSERERVNPKVDRKRVKHDYDRWPSLKFVGGDTIRVSEALKSLVLSQDKICVWCRDSPATTIDHVHPRSRGGTHSLLNLVGACGECNVEKGDFMPSEIGWVLKIPRRAFDFAQLENIKEFAASLGMHQVWTSIAEKKVD